jgi:cysteate synthase
MEVLQQYKCPCCDGSIEFSAGAQRMKCPFCDTEFDMETLLAYDAEQARCDARMIMAKVLSNRNPPYSIAGGLYDALKATNGDVLKVSNVDVCRAMQLFSKSENVDINPASAVAVASLLNKVKDGTISQDATVLLNITGGGENLYRAGRDIYYLRPSHIFPIAADERDVLLKVEELFA